MVRTGFHPLVVAGVEPVTDDSAAITFAVPGELAGDFVFSAGQSLTIRRGQDNSAMKRHLLGGLVGTLPKFQLTPVIGAQNHNSTLLGHAEDHIGSGNDCLLI